MLRNIIRFLKLETSFDAFRNMSIFLIVSLLAYQYFTYETTIAIGVGIILSCLTDIPGTKKDKIISAISCVTIFFITSLLASLAIFHESWWIIVLLACIGFIYTFISLLGFRIGLIGSLGLIVASFTIGLKPDNPFIYTLALSAGALVYYFISILHTLLAPHRSVKFAINKTVINMSHLIRLKVDCYDETKNINDAYKRLSKVHVKLSEQTENIRSLILREKSVLKSNNQETIIWLSKLYHLIDLYELLMANDLEYEKIRDILADSTALPLIRKSLQILSYELKSLSDNTKQNSQSELIEIIEQLEHQSTKSNERQTTIITSIIAQIQQIQNIIHNIKQKNIYKNESWISQKSFKNFTTKEFDIKVFSNHFNKNSTIFLYAIRMSLLLVLGGLFGYLLPEYKYASWVILTIILVARPTFHNTQIRNKQRTLGSFIGVIISISLLLILQDNSIILTISLFTLFLFFLFNQLNYMVSVIFVTIAIVLFQYTYDGNTVSIIISRFLFTLLGAGLAIVGCLAIPINHYFNVQNTTKLLITNYKQYLDKLSEVIENRTINFYELRLSRKLAQTSLAQFYDVLTQIEREPLFKRKLKIDIDKFQSIAYKTNAQLIGLSVNITRDLSSSQENDFEERIHRIQKLIAESEEIAKTLQ